MSKFGPGIFVSAHHTSHDLSDPALGLTLMQSTTPLSTQLKLKDNLPTVTKSILMNLTTNCSRLPAENLAVIISKITLKSNCNHVPADDVMRVQKRKYLTY